MLSALWLAARLKCSLALCQPGLCFEGLLPAYLSRVVDLPALVGCVTHRICARAMSAAFGSGAAASTAALPSPMAPSPSTRIPGLCAPCWLLSGQPARSSLVVLQPCYKLWRPDAYINSPSALLRKCCHQVSWCRRLLCTGNCTIPALGLRYLPAFAV